MKTTLITIFCLLSGLCCMAQGKANLTVYAPVLSPHDTLELYIWENLVSIPSRNPYRIFKASNRNGVFHFDIDSLQKRSWFSLNLSFQKLDGRPIHNIMEHFLMEAGDNVTIYLSPRLGKIRSLSHGYDGNTPVLTENWNIRFQGTGATKYIALQHIITSANTENKTAILATMDKNTLNEKITLQYILQEGALKILNGYIEMLPADIYGIIEGQIRGRSGNEIGRTLEELRYFAKGEQEKHVVREELDRYLANLCEYIPAHSDLFVHSPFYIEYLLQYYWLAFTGQSEGEGGVAAWYSYCKKVIKPSLLRDRVLTSLLMKRFQNAPQNEILEDALTTINEPYCLTQLELLSRHVFGNRAYEFSLPDAKGKYYSLEDFQGKVVFMDFWYAACIPCRRYMTEVVSSVKRKYKDNPNVVFVTVSTDGLETFRRVIEQEEFLPKGGIHLYTDNMRYGHPIIKYYQITAYPFPLLLGKDGRITAGANSLRDVDKLSTAIQVALEK